MSQLKRKSLGRSVSSDQSGDGDAPNKRVKVEGVEAGSPGAKEKSDRNGSVSRQNGHKESLSPDGRQPEDAVTRSASQEQQSRPSESRRRRSSSPQAVRSPQRDRRPSESRRRDRSPPPGRDRLGSEVSRRGSVSHQAAFSERDRIRRGPEVSRDEEKKRGKRLFGGLLSTLSQTTTNSQQKRRQEIEKKQQEKAAKQKTEDDKRRAERLAKLDRTRKIEQVRFDEQVVSHLFRARMRLHARTVANTLVADANPPFQHARHGTQPTYQKRAKASE